ncbi:hypothetical protein VKT23_010492 [Stygiomarasmius scandens]|uniref:Uncharacterized protein n=1 Tax=Marasmiellus scandens TaxID=2682957 RepID=A0ABR1JEG9_9AGAR
MPTPKEDVDLLKPVLLNIRKSIDSVATNVNRDLGKATTHTNVRHTPSIPSSCAYVGIALQALLAQIGVAVPSAESSLLSLQSIISSIISSPEIQALRSVIETGSREVHRFIIELSHELVLAGEFPDLTTTPNHQRRVDDIRILMDSVEAALLMVTSKRNIPEDKVKGAFGGVRRGIETVWILVGGLIEQYPVLFEVLLFCITLFLPILGLFGIDPLDSDAKGRLFPRISWTFVLNPTRKNSFGFVWCNCIPATFVYNPSTTDPEKYFQVAPYHR